MANQADRDRRLAGGKVRVFISYAHADAEWRQKLEKALSPLKREGLIEVWHDGRMTAGSEFTPEIAKQLHEAHIVLLLVSADFFASDYCWEREMELALRRHEQHAARVVPIILRPCDWQQAPFARLLVLPADGRALSLWDDEDGGLTDVARGLRRAVAELRKA